MSIFEKFNNQGLNDDAAFEELCCQLFETWGTRTMGFDASWDYLDIRGDGGDGGIEAYWRNTNTGEYIGIQAKWFKKSITKSQYGQIRRSVDTAMKLRSNMTKYIVCVPHNLTSLRNGKGGTVNRGEEDAWKDFKRALANVYPDLELLLWDEHSIGSLLQDPANEGRWRFWFERTAINRDEVRLTHLKAIEGLRDRYVPEIIDNGDMALFLDNFFGTTESRSRLIDEIDACLDVCYRFSDAIDSFVMIGDELPDELKELAIKCHDAMSAYADALIAWHHMLMVEPRELVQIDDITVDYGAIEDFESEIYDLKRKHKFGGHVDELLKLFDNFRELPGEYGIRGTMRDAFSYPHCLVIGDQGTGKTCGFAQKASAYLKNDNHLPIFVHANEIDERDGWKDVVCNALGLGDWDETVLWQALSSSAAMRDVREVGITIRAKVAVFVDGLDERQPASRWTRLIREGNAITKEHPRIRFACSTRPYGIERNGADDLSECVYYVDDNGDVPVQDLFDRYIEHYSIDLRGNTRYKWMLRTPMELSMFCSAYKGMRLDKEVSICLTALVNVEVDRLEREYAKRIAISASMHETPVRSTLIALADAFLQNDKPRDFAEMESLIETAGIQRETVGSMLDFLERYGILFTIRRAGRTSVSPMTIMYQPGSRHLWDYFMALILVDTDDILAADILLRHSDAAHMYAILLIEKRGILPLEVESLVNTLGSDRARQLTIDALASSEKDAARKFRQWVLDEIAKSKDTLSDIVNGIIVQVADEKEHPLGPTLLDDYLRTFQAPAERDIVWSIPRTMHDGSRLSMYTERDAVKHLPQLHQDDKWSQMPLLLAWCLTSVSNLRRRHCANELVKWAQRNPEEFADLFDLFRDCDDPQVREDMFAIAEEVVCQGRLDAEAKGRFGNMALESLFIEPDKPGNRDAALRYYGRILVERCCVDGIFDASQVDLCRPPYKIESTTSVLPIYAAAAKADRMGGYETIHYDLARYVLVDELESAFGIPRIHANGDFDSEDALRLAKQSADMAGIEQPSFEGWVISAAYQYLVDRGYDPDVFAGAIDKRGYRLGGIDRGISGAFGRADHGLQSTIMTVAEKYVWCARNEICGFMADRVPVHKSSWRAGLHQERSEFVRDYSMLLSYQSPLFEATVNSLSAERAGALPSFPTAFTCNDRDAVCTEQELRYWIDHGDADAVTALLGYLPNVTLSLEGDVVPIAIFASDWGIGGKQAYGWAYGGVVTSSELAKLGGDGKVAINGYDNASAFSTGIDVDATYISPVEYMSSAWVGELDEKCEHTKVADVHISANPLSGSGVDSLTDIGDYWYRFPSKLAMDLCGVTRTDGARYFDSNGEVVFEDVDYGMPYRQQYQALLADRTRLLEALAEKDLHLVWYATLQRGGNSLAIERLPQLKERSEESWLIWLDGDGGYLSRTISDEYSIPEGTYEPSGLIKELLEKYTGEAEEDEEMTVG